MVLNSHGYVYLLYDDGNDHQCISFSKRQWFRKTSCINQCNHIIHGQPNWKSDMWIFCRKVWKKESFDLLLYWLYIRLNSIDHCSRNQRSLSYMVWFGNFWNRIWRDLYTQAIALCRSIWP